MRMKNISPSAQWLRPHSATLSGLVWVCIALFVLVVAANPNYQWDTRIFHAAPAVLETGHNPYDWTNPALNYPQGLSYLYPPIVLYVFQPLSELPYPEARLVWLAIKLFALACLIRLWHRHFEHLNASWPMVLFLALGFNAALLRDITAGNISIFEELGIWFGFALLVRGRPFSAGLILAITAQFKLMPVVLLGLLLFVGPPPRWKPFAVSLGAFAALFALNFLFLPEMMRHYIESFGYLNSNLDERGELNPSSLALIRDLVDKAARLGLPLTRSVADVVYLSYVGLFGLLVLWIVRTYDSVLNAKDPRWLIYCGCVLYVLTMPRVKDYSYIILLIPSLFVIRQILTGTLRPTLLLPLVAVLIFTPPTFDYVPVLGSVVPWLQSYQPWLVAWCLLYYLLRVNRPGIPAGSAPAALK